MNQRMTLRKRASGILLHLTSLPGPQRIGDLGPEAYRFADFLAEAGQSWWQMLPVCPPGLGNSPYMGLSAFAGNPLLISLEKLAADGLLSPREIKPGKAFLPEKTRYGAAARFKESRLRKAFQAFEEGESQKDKKRFDAFCASNDSWLSIYALFATLKRMYPGIPWTGWEPGIRSRKPSALTRVRNEQATELRFQKFVQYVFHLQWSELQRYCAKLGIGLIGDMPIYVAHESADVWAYPELFQLTPQGRPTVVAGIPPDYFSKTGQLWGNPLYRWDTLQARHFDWWVARLKVTFERFNAIRLDHFVGFHKYWEVPATARTAESGRWAEGPGVNFFETVLDILGPIELIAEDLGVVSPEVKTLRDRFSFPGMRVLQFAFGNDPEAENYKPHKYPRRCIVYTGTHDNDTIVGWFHDTGSRASTRTKEEIQRERELALRYLGSDGREIHWDMIRLALQSVGDITIFPVQDILGLGSEARMNLPGVMSGNWEWRLPQGALSQQVASRLLLLTETFGRIPR